MGRASIYIDALKSIQDLGRVPDIHKQSLTISQQYRIKKKRKKNALSKNKNKTLNAYIVITLRAEWLN